jgi:hypothetical protein
MTALAPECRVSSMAHVVAFAVHERGRLRMVAAHGAYFFKAIQATPSDVCCMDWESCFRKRALGRRGVHQVIVDFVSPAA